MAPDELHKRVGTKNEERPCMIVLLKYVSRIPLVEPHFLTCIQVSSLLESRFVLCGEIK